MHRIFSIVLIVFCNHVLILQDVLIFQDFLISLPSARHCQSCCTDFTKFVSFKSDCEKYYNLSFMSRLPICNLSQTSGSKFDIFRSDVLHLHKAFLCRHAALLSWKIYRSNKLETFQFALFKDPQRTTKRRHRAFQTLTMCTEMHYIFSCGHLDRTKTTVSLRPVWEASPSCNRPSQSSLSLPSYRLQRN